MSDDSEEVGPIYGVTLMNTLPLGSGKMLQALPARGDLNRVMNISERTVAGYEVLLDHYRHKCKESDRLKEAIRRVISGNWNVTELQELIGDV